MLLAHHLTHAHNSTNDRVFSPSVGIVESPACAIEWARTDTDTHMPPTMKCHGKLKQFSNYVQSNRTDTIIIIAVSTPTAGALCFSLNVKCNLALHTNDRQITPENASIAALFGSTRQFCCRFNLQLFVALVCLCFFLVLLIQECCLC